MESTKLDGKMKFYYFPLHVRGSHIRMCLDKAGVEHEDVVVQFSDWGALKPSMPGKQVPCLELADGTKIGESLAILRMLGSKFGFYPKDPYEAFLVDEQMDNFASIIGTIYKPWGKKEETEKATCAAEVFDTLLPKYLESIDAACAKGQFIAGEKLTIADFCVGGIYTNYVVNPKIDYGPAEKWTEILEKFPNFKAYGERFAAEMKEHLEKREEFVV